MKKNKVKFYILKHLTEIFILPIWRMLDLIIPKNSSYWAFPVHFIKSELFIENPRAVYERLKDQNDIKKIIFYRKKPPINISGLYHNSELVSLYTLKGLYMLSRCKVVFVSNGISFDYSLRFHDKFSIIKVNLKRRRVVNLWHGIPLKKLFFLANDNVKNRTTRVRFRNYERGEYTGLICSSKADSYAMATIFYPIQHHNVWITGLPRNDFLLLSIDSLPKYIQSEIVKLKELKSGKKLICYAPTYRQTLTVGDASYYQFTINEIELLKELLKKHNAILGFRMHYFRNKNNLFNIEDFIDNELIFDLGHEKVSEVAALIRETDMMITDYSSVYIDSLYVNKPVFSFAYDLNHYSTKQDGLLYNMDMVFPGPVVMNFQTLILELDKELTSSTQVESDSYRFAKQFFFDYLDTYNSERVINRVLKTL